jgi:hypothetical protein
MIAAQLSVVKVKRMKRVKKKKSTVKPLYKDTGYKDNLADKDIFLGPAGISFVALHISL